MTEFDQPTIEIRLWADRSCYLLSHQPRFSLVVFVTLRGGTGQKPITIVRRDDGSLGVGLVNLLSSQFIECVDAEFGRTVLVLGDVDADSERQKASSLGEKGSVEHSARATT